MRNRFHCRAARARPRSRHLPAVAFAAAVFAVPLRAEDEGAVPLAPYEVVGSPVSAAPAAGAFAAAITSIDDTQVRDLAALDLASALRRTPGVTISRFNQVGAFGGAEGGAIFLRGLGSSRPGGEIKTMIDGAPKMNGIFNHPLLDLVSVDSAARIDVHLRAAPLEYGNAFAVIDIATPSVDREGTLLRASAAGGSFGTWVERVDLGLRRGGFEAYASQSLKRSDGHRPDSGGRMNNLLARAAWEPAPGWRLAYTLNRTDNFALDPGRDDLPGGAPSTRGERYETADWFHAATLAHESERAQGSVRVYLEDGQGDWLRRERSGAADTLASWRLHGLRWKETVHPWDGATVVAGLDLDTARGTVRSRPPAPAPERVFGPEAMRLFSAYAGLAQALAPTRTIECTPSIGARFYEHDVFGFEGAGQAGLRVVAGRTQAHAGYSRAVSHPGLEVAAFSRIYIPALGASWRSLRPETADQCEAGLRHDFEGGSCVAVTLFRNDGRNRYVIVFPPPPPPRYANVETWRTEGIEATAEIAASERLKAFAGVALLRTTPDDLPYAPRRSITAGVTWAFARDWAASVDGISVSSMHVASAARVAGAGNPVRVGGQFSLNARLSRRFAWGHGRGEAYVSGENLADRDFAWQPGYPIPGINFMLGLRFER